MTNPILNRVLTRLSPTGRQGRRPFLLTVLAIWVVMIVLNYLFGLIGLNVVGSVVGVLALLMTGLPMVKRLHDFNRPFEVTFFLFPIAHLKQMLGLFISSRDEVSNDFGPVTKN